MSGEPTGSDGARAKSLSRWPVALVAVALAAAVLWVLLAAAVPIGAGDSLGFSRRADVIVRAADRALASTGVGGEWRLLAWACGVGTLVLGVVLVWVAGSERDAAVASGVGPDISSCAGAIAGRGGLAGDGGGVAADENREGTGAVSVLTQATEAGADRTGYGRGADEAPARAGRVADPGPADLVVEAERSDSVPESAAFGGADRGESGWSGTRSGLGGSNEPMSKQGADDGAAG